MTIAAFAALPLVCGAEDSASRSGDGGLELSDVIASYARRSNQKFIVDPRVRASGGLVGIDANKITYEQLLALASMHGAMVVKSDDVTIFAPDANARQQPTPVYTNANFKALDDEWVTLLLAPKNACSGQLVPVLRPLMPQAAHMAADIQSNTLILSDRAVNLRRIAGMIEKLDAGAPAGRRCQDMEFGAKK
jgi:general secretion pathway protein D